MVVAGEHWYPHEDADAYLLTAAWHLSRAARAPHPALITHPGASATLFCAFAAEAYVNVALVVLVGELEYEALKKIPVRSKYFLAGRLGAREAWYDGGESALLDLDALFRERNRLAHGDPQRKSNRFGVADPPPSAHESLANVARWLATTVDAVSRLAQSDGDLASMGRVPDHLKPFDALFRRFDPERDGDSLARSLRRTFDSLIIEDNEDWMDGRELAELLDAQNPDWDSISKHG